MIQYLRLRHTFDAPAMQREVARLTQNDWKAHYNHSHYEGDWSVLPLRALGGAADSIVSVHTGAAAPGMYRDTPLLDTCPYLRSVIDSFDCRKTSIRLMKLSAGALIREHTDHDMHLEAGEARLHIPVQTNPDVAFYIMNDRIPMQEGECWYLNLSLPHRVHNAGATDRIHLVIDCIANDWLKQLLGAPGLYRKEAASVWPDRHFSPEEQERIIAELRRLNTPAALQQAAALEAGR